MVDLVTTITRTASSMSRPCHSIRRTHVTSVPSVDVRVSKRIKRLKRISSCSIDHNIHVQASYNQQSNPPTTKKKEEKKPRDHVTQQAIKTPHEKQPTNDDKKTQ
jgi:hypothetical protein